MLDSFTLAEKLEESDLTASIAKEVVHTIHDYHIDNTVTESD